jgi:hypothetical protein
MPTTVTIRDETASGEETNRLTLDMLSARVTLRELIRSRVYQEVQDWNRSARGKQSMLVRPAKETVDWEKAFARAVDAFESNGYFVLVDDRQVGSLDDEVELTADTKISFVRLVPLVGG